MNDGNGLKIAGQETGAAEERKRYRVAAEGGMVDCAGIAGQAGALLPHGAEIEALPRDGDPLVDIGVLASS